MKKDIIDGVLMFYKKTSRLPVHKEDKIQVGDGLVSASLNINREFGDQEKLVEYLLDKEYTSYEKIADIVKDTPARVKNLMTRNVKKADIDLRRKLDVLLGVDYYNKIDTPYHTMCQRCKKDCKQHYYVMLSCKKYTKK